MCQNCNDGSREDKQELPWWSVIFNWIFEDFLERQKPAFCQNSTLKICNLALCHSVIENISSKTSNDAIAGVTVFITTHWRGILG